MESNVWMVFESGIEGHQGLLRGKEDSNEQLGKLKEAETFNELLNDSNYLISTKSALDLNELPNDSIDYCFTDPPYGGSIQYLELSTLWLSWLRGSNNDPRFQVDFEDEITINEQQKKNFDYYHKMLRVSFGQVYRVLKSGKYLTVTFHNANIRIYNSILKAVVLAGFDLEKVIYQPPARASAKGLLQPYGSAIGDYYIRFRKPISPRGALMESSEIDEVRYERIIVDAVKKILAERGEPVPYSIIINSYPMIYEELKNNGYLLSTPENIEKVLKRNINKEFELVIIRNEDKKIIGKKWWFKNPDSIPYLERIPLAERVENAIIGVLNRKIRASFDDILQEIFIKFPNSLTPDTESIKLILGEYAIKTKDGKWRLRPDVSRREREHNKIVEILCNLGLNFDYEIYGDVSEYRKPIDIKIPKTNLDRVKEIDVLWYKNGKIEYEFEVENTTGITEAIIRGANIPYPVKKYIVIPDERENLIVRKMEEPALKDLIQDDEWGFIRYDELLDFYNDNKNRKTLDINKIEALSRMPVTKKIKSSMLTDFTKQ
jgi:hypothetical protein